MSILDDLLNGAASVGKGALGAVGNVAEGALNVASDVGEMYVAGAAPYFYRQQQYEKNLAEQRGFNQQARDQFWDQNRGQMAQPAQNLAPDAFSNEESQVAQQLDPTGDPVYQDAQQGSGFLGGNMTPQQQAVIMAGSNAPGIRQQGLSVLGQLLTQKPGNPYSNITRGAQGNAFGINNQGQQVRLPGAPVPQRETRQDPSFQQYQGFSPQQRAAFDQFKGRQAAGTLTAKDRSGMENTLRDDYRSQAKDFEVMNTAYNRISGAQKGGIGDVAMIFSFMKLLDPTSTVREGEFATAANAGGAFAQIGNTYNRLVNGEVLPDDVRKAILAQAKSYHSESQKKSKRLRADFVSNAGQYGLNGRNIVGSQEQPKQQERHYRPIEEMTQAERDAEAAEIRRELGL